jgi:hypothetical protein
MRPPEPFVEECRVCENRRVIYVGGQDTQLVCPGCSAWCVGCLEGWPQRVRPHRLMLGVHVAGMRRMPSGDALFKGYACDYHRAALNTYSGLPPWMLGSEYPAGTAFIAVQQPFAFISLLGYGEAANWQELHEDAWVAVREQGYGIAWQGTVYYECPEGLAAQVKGLEHMM